MRLLGYLAAALVLLLLGTSPAMAKMAMIETAAPIKGQSQDSVKAALKEAVDTAAKGAVAMGLPWVQIRDARVLENMVAIQVMATDEAPQQADKGQGGPGTQQTPALPEQPSTPDHSKPGPQLHPEQPQPGPGLQSNDKANL